jgi:hypothetical protein
VALVIVHTISMPPLLAAILGVRHGARFAASITDDGASRDLPGELQTSPHRCARSWLHRRWIPRAAGGRARGGRRNGGLHG